MISTYKDAVLLREYTNQNKLMSLSVDIVEYTVYTESIVIQF